jgi:hypothetical protein
MHDLVFLIPILTSLGFFAMVFGIMYLKKKENLAMIANGMNPKTTPDRPVPYKNLKWGLLLLGGGVGLLLAYFINTYVTKDDNPALWFALLAIGGGLGLIRSYSIEKAELLNHRTPIE